MILMSDVCAKNILSVFAIFLLVLNLIVPLGALSAYFCGCLFEFVSIRAFYIVIALLAVALTVLSLKIKSADGILKLILFLLTPAAILNAALVLLGCVDVCAVVSGCVCAGCCCYLTVKYPGKVLRTASLTFASLIILSVVFIALIIHVFGDLSSDTVVSTVYSPDGAYRADVIDNDQGALGGNTFVDVYETECLDLFVFRVLRKPVRVYAGDWGEFENMVIYWKDDGCLVIDAEEYEMHE